MSKRILMLSTAAVALLSGAALADTTIDSTSGSKTDPYTTGALLVSTDKGTANAGNITIKSGYSLTVSGMTATSGLAQGAVTIDTNNWLLNQGTIIAKDNDDAVAIHATLSANPDYTNTSIPGLTSGATASTTGIYLDNASITSAEGSGSSKIGLWLDSNSCAAVCTFKGAVTMAGGSSLTVTGDKSVGIQLGSTSSTSTVYGVLQGDMTIGGTVTASATTTGNNSSTSLAMYGLLSYGKINGNLILASGGTIASYGEGAIGMYVAGQGVTGSLQINGTLASSVLNSNSNTYNYTQKINTTTNPEAGPALIISAGVGGGVSIGGPSAGGTSAAGTVAMQGASSAIIIAQQSSPTAPMYIGVFADSTNPGFSFYNRGSVTAQDTNYNKPATAMTVNGNGVGTETIFAGGMFVSGSMSATAATSNDATSSSSVAASGLVIGDYVKLLPNTSVKNAASNTDPGDQAALVISGLSTSSGISASVSGTRGGTARAIWISGAKSSVPSLINTGTISATATTTTATLTGNTSSTDPLTAIALEDDSGSLASIINSGTISAQAGYAASSSTSPSALDNNSQTAIAIYVAGNSTGTTIKNYASASRSAIIAGDITFGGGKNQVLDLMGSDTKGSVVVGNVTYGYTADAASADQLHIGMNSTLTGKVVTNAPYGGVAVTVDSAGTLNLLNTTTSLTASTVTVAKNGTFTLGVNRSLSSGGMVNADAINVANGANLGVSYASFLPKSAQSVGSGSAPAYQFVLMSSGVGQMTIGQSVVDTFNNAKDTFGNPARPYLLKTASMCNTGNGSCASFSKPDSTKDYLVINVQMKDAVDPNPKIGDANTNSAGVHTNNYIGLTAGSVAVIPVTTDKGAATTLFEQANKALAVDDELGAAFLNGITDAAQAQKAYNDMAPGITGGTRAIVISITDSATGPVAARQRALRMYGKTTGDFTIWGQEFVQMLKDPGTGATDPNTGFKTSPGFKDHGFGFSVGIDSGSPKYGWYGGALTFYAGDVNELSRNAHQNEQWYLLSLYSDWRGKGLFLDTKIDAGYGQIDGKRTLALLRPTSYASYWPNSAAYYIREADNKHAGALIAGSVATGAMMSYGAATLMPQVNIDGMYMREEGYTEKNPNTTTVGDGFDLKVGQYYAKSLRAFFGFDMRYDLKLWDFYLQPEARVGYRYDFISDPVKLKAAFAYSNVTGNSVGAGDTFELRGPDPAKGNLVLGGTIAATTDTWTLGLNFDFVKGGNGVFQQTATVNIVGRI